MENEKGGDGSADDTTKNQKAIFIRFIAAFNKYRTDRKAEREKESPQDRAAKRTAFASVVVAAFTVVTAAVGVFSYFILQGQLIEMRITRESGDKTTTDQMAIMRDQAKAMQGQLDQLAAAQRPWIEITSVNILKMEIAKDWVFIWADVGIKNVGHSPAIDLHIKPVLRPDISLTEEAVAVQLACDEAKSSTFNIYQTVLFPGEERTIHPNESLFETTVAVIEADKKGRAWDDYIRSKEFFGNRKALDEASQTLSLPLRNGLSLIGCVAYKTQGSEVAHATSFGRYLNRSCEPSPTGMCSFDFSTPTIIANNIIVIRDFLSANYAD